MISLDKGLIISTFNSALALIKAYIDGRVSTLSSSILDLDAAVDGKGNCDILQFQNVSVATSKWASSTTYSDYSYRASVTCSGVTANHNADVVFALADAVGGNFAPVCETGANLVHIYAKEKPTAAITINIEARKVVA